MVRGPISALLTLLVVVLPSAATAQQSRLYAGGALMFNAQPHSTTEPLGGTTWAGSVLFGVQISPRVAVEVEPSFGGRYYSGEYTYRPWPGSTVSYVASRRDTFLSFQVRTRLGVVEPVVGFSYVRESVDRVYALGQDVAEPNNAAALVGGLDAPLRLSDHFFLVPTFRLFAVMRSASATTILAQDASTGALAFRGGIGARLAF